jgi:hypothetical protein
MTSNSSTTVAPSAKDYCQRFNGFNLSIIRFALLLPIVVANLPQASAEQPTVREFARPSAQTPDAIWKSLPHVIGGDWGNIQQPLDKLDLVTLKQAGVETLVLGINVGWNGAMRRYIVQKTAGLPYPNKTFWNGRDSYDPESVREILNLVHQQHPTARLILWLQIDTYPEWITENPSEALRNDRGEGFVVNYHFQRVGDDPNPAKREVLAWSFFSEKLRKDLQPMLKAFVQTVEGAVGGHQVVGYLIGGAQDAQFYLWEGPNSAKARDARVWSDYSAAAVRAWHQWLRNKYGTPEKLSAVWYRNVDAFDKVEPPAAESLIGTERFHDPEKEVAQRNWKEFIADGRVSLAEDIAVMIRQAATRPVLIGTSSGDNGARANMTANVRLMHSKEFDFLNGPVRYNQRLAPVSPGGALTVSDSFRLNGKPILFDLDYRTWKNQNNANRKVGPGYLVNGRMVGRANNAMDLRNAWLRETGRAVLSGHKVFLDPVEGAETFQDPLIQHEMSVLRASLETAGTPLGAGTGAEVAVIYDERATDYLKGALGDLHMIWSSGQRSELDLSGLPYGYYYLDDFVAGRVPPAKLYIFNNLLEIDAATAKAIEKVKKDNAVLCFLQGTGFNLQGKESDRLSQIVGMNLVPATRAGNVRPVKSTEPLLTGLPAPGFALPSEWVAFGPFTPTASQATANVPLELPGKLEWDGQSRSACQIPRESGFLDFSALGQVPSDQVVWVFTQIESDYDREVVIGAGADWWMTWYLNGEQVFDTSDFGNEYTGISSDNHLFPLRLKKGSNLLVARLKAGSRGLKLAVESREEIEASHLSGQTEGLKLDSQLGLVVDDAEARPLALYPQSDLVGFAERRHEGWTSIFAGTHSLRRSTLSALTKRAGAWSVAPFQTVVAANSNFLLVHTQLSGKILLSLKHAAALSEVNGAIPSRSLAKNHLLNLEAFQTYLFALGDKNTLPGSTPRNATVIAPGTLVQFDFTDDAGRNAGPKGYRPVDLVPNGQVSNLITGSGLSESNLGISGNGSPPKSLFINPSGLGSRSREEALQKQSWFGFQLSPSAQTPLALEALEFQIQRSKPGSPRRFAVEAAWGDRTQFLGEGCLSSTTGNSNAEFVQYRVELGDFPDLRSLTSSVTFRVFLFSVSDQQPATNADPVRVDNITLRGWPAGQ